MLQKQGLHPRLTLLIQRLNQCLTHPPTQFPLQALPHHLPKLIIILQKLLFLSLPLLHMSAISLLISVWVKRVQHNHSSHVVAAPAPSRSSYVRCSCLIKLQHTSPIINTVPTRPTLTSQHFCSVGNVFFLQVLQVP